MLLGDLSRSGFEVVEEHEGTDAIVVNTCAFVEDAKAGITSGAVTRTFLPTSALVCWSRW